MDARWAEILIVAAGGAAGSVARYGVGRLLPAAHTLSATMMCNLTGCLAIGIVAALFRHFEAGQWLYLLVITGIMGGYTTYSAFALDAVRFLEAGHHGEAISYVLTTLIGAVVACTAGYFGTSSLLRLLQPS